jgi:hypothetical protein
MDKKIMLLVILQDKAGENTSTFENRFYTKEGEVISTMEL